MIYFQFKEIGFSGDGLANVVHGVLYGFGRKKRVTLSPKYDRADYSGD